MQEAVDPDDAQVVLLRDACAAPRPRTSAARSVWESAGASGQRRRAAHVVAPNPAELPVVDVPAPTRRHPPSPWRAVFDALPPGKATTMTEAQAIALATWARQNGRKVRRQRVEGDTFAVWREG